MATLKLVGDEARVLEFLHAYIALHGYAPTMKEIGAALGVSDTHAWRQVRALERKRRIRRGPHGACRALALLPSPA